MLRARRPRMVGILIVVVLAAGCDYVERASVDTSGGDTNGDSFHPSISADGRYVAFWSSANDLVADDGDGNQDVFVRDMRNNSTSRVSVDTGGGDSDGDSFYPTISDDGRYVAFVSRASDLVAGDSGTGQDVFVRDLQSGTTTRVSVDTAGGPPNLISGGARISADGRHVVFTSIASDLVLGDGNGLSDIFVRDLDAHTTVRASVDTANGDANGHSGGPEIPSPPAIDADGSRVVFFSDASDLVAADGNGLSDMFMRDLTAGTMTRVSVDTTGGDANGPSDYVGGTPAITGDGEIVAFASSASDLVSSDANGAGSDVFVRDIDGMTTTLASADSHGGSSPSISDDGRFVAFQTTQIWVHDNQNDSTAMASAKFARPANGISGQGEISADGRYVAFHSSASNLIDGDGNHDFDIYVRAVWMPKIDSVTPDTVAAGSSATLTAIGSKFLAPMVASVGPGVTVDSVTVISETELEVSVTVDPDASPGARTMHVWTPGTGPGTYATTGALCVGCITIT